MKSILTTTVRINSEASKLLPVKTDKPVAYETAMEIMKEVAEMELVPPVKLGEVVASGVCGKKINLISTKNVEK
ncbi:MAG: DUF1667 domain-containing protein [Clostridia bacterium]|nr:DUF1667 domain-containing protein [Clostridia bacterium]